MGPTTLFLFIVVYQAVFCTSQEDYQAPKNSKIGSYLEFFKINEWERFLNYQRKGVKEILRENRTIKKKKFSRSKNKNNPVAPHFMLSRTKSGYIVKQLEPGLKSKNSGGFELPKEPALMVNVNYRFDGSVSPIVKLSETNKGVVGKRLEYGFAEMPGINWSGRTGSLRVSKYKTIKTISKEGKVDKDAGINRQFPTGSVSLRGTLKILNSSLDFQKSQIKEIEEISTDENYDIENEYYRGGNNIFETEDVYYTFPFENSDEEDSYNNEESENMSENIND